jgi:hypothetical protein
LAGSSGDGSGGDGGDGGGGGGGDGGGDGGGMSTSMATGFTRAFLPLYDGTEHLLSLTARCDRPAMVLPSTLPPPPPHLGPDVIRANELLVNGYRVARDVVNLGQPNLHQVRYHQERVWSELVPLLDAVFESASDTATRSWCYKVTETITDLFNHLTQCEASVLHRFVVLYFT